ncbi:hypothetical protein LTS18_014584 [Coniosporium uncinatum]|uniref:Uncharacterized protein n=1 Tax=Coniosporium uncinatum TaxID=93489 RepID=A0ACC3DYS7_9PEZI|nr:hypothetical protein LTS18_014584 [Coniosporium uncinatum]
MSITSRATDTGPLPSTMSPMTVELHGPKGRFAHLDLPEIHTSSRGADIHIADQHIDILDMEAYPAFVRSIMLDERLTLSLENGKATVKALGMKSNIVYAKEVQLRGMNGPQIALVRTVVDGDGDGGDGDGDGVDGGEGAFTNTTVVRNPSPLEIDLGVVSFDILNAEGVKIASEEGEMYLPKGESTHTRGGRVVKGVGAKVGPGKMVGTGAKGGMWVDETIRFLSQAIEINGKLAVACS